jgi:hypothetical protein
MHRHESKHRRSNAHDSQNRQEGSVWTVIHDRPEARNDGSDKRRRAHGRVSRIDADKTASVAVLYGRAVRSARGSQYVSTLDPEHPLGELDIRPRPRGNGARFRADRWVPRASN